MSNVTASQPLKKQMVIGEARNKENVEWWIWLRQKLHISDTPMKRKHRRQRYEDTRACTILCITSKQKNEL